MDSEIAAVLEGERLNAITRNDLVLLILIAAISTRSFASATGSDISGADVCCVYDEKDQSCCASLSTATLALMEESKVSSISFFLFIISSARP